VLLTRCRTGEPPNATLSALAAMAAVQRNPPPRLSDESIWSSDFVDFIRRCLVKDPDKRPDAAQLMAHPFVTQPSAVDKRLLKAIFDKVPGSGGGGGGGSAGWTALSVQTRRTTRRSK
jgi:serine/threonine protein kinase